MSHQLNVDELLQTGILAETNSDELKISDNVINTRENYLTTVRDSSPTDVKLLLEDSTISDSLSSTLTTISDHTPELVADYLTVRDYLDEDRAAIDALPLVDQLVRTQPPWESVPEAFTPIHADRLSAYLQLVPCAVVYIWRRNCDPCDTMVTELDNLFKTAPDDLALFAIYGPEWAELLSSKYNVDGGPTTLFAHDGEIDARLIGAHYASAIQNEIKMIRTDKA